jgi:hypothetical protein
LRNQGVGPAIIEDIRVRAADREVAGDPFDFYTAVRPGVDMGPVDVHKIMPGRLIRDGESLRMIGIETAVGGVERRGQMMVDLLKLFHVAEVPKAWYATVGLAAPQGAIVEITYKSVFGDRWRIRSDRLVPEEID